MTAGASPAPAVATSLPAPVGTARPPHRRLLGAAAGARLPLVGAVALGLAAAALAIAQAALLSGVISAAFLDGTGLGPLAGPLALLAGVLIARSCLAWATDVLAQRTSGRVKSALRTSLLRRAVELGPRWAADRPSSEVTLLATRGLDALDAYYGRYLPQVALAAIVPVAVVVALALVDVVAAITVAVTVPLIPVFMVLVGRLSESHRSRRWRALAMLGRRFGDVVAGLPTLRAYGAAATQVGVLRVITDRYRTTTMETLRVAFLSALVLELLATISVALVAVGVGVRLVEGSLTFAAGLFAVVLAPEAYLPLRRLGAEFHASEEALTVASAVLAIVDAPVVADPAGLEPPVAPTTLIVDDVSVDQPGREIRAPDRATFEVRSGEVVAVAGPSGAGKSTLLLTILGLVAPTRGRVLVRGAEGAALDVRRLAGDAWRHQVAWVPQVPFLFAGTIADNVRLAAPLASDAAVAEALAAVGLADLDPDRRVGERGQGLSSGQRRRVGVARALVRKAPVLLLDEPTAGLDADAEAAVLRAVRAAAGAGSLVVLVAHRPGALALADRTIELAWRTSEAEAMPADEPAGRSREATA